jgi:rare lipoprotein A
VVGFCAVRRSDLNTAITVGVFVATSCMSDSRPRVAPPPAPAPPLSAAKTSPAPAEPAFQKGYATYYARRFAGRKTANGERYDPSALTAAHRTLPFGTLVEVSRTDGDARKVVVRVNDRGPYGGANRIIDLSRRAAEELGIVHDGKVMVELRYVNAGAVAPAARGAP